LRAHAFIGGPSFTIDSNTSWTTFMHEQGHIFGADDEYCPDACTPSTFLAGYLGVPNANATYTEFVGGPGHKYGAGEGQPSFNTVDVVQVHFGAQAACLACVDDGVWFDVPLQTPVKGQTSIDLDLGSFPQGLRTLEVRAKNSVGNLSATHKLTVVSTTSTPN